MSSRKVAADMLDPADVITEPVTAKNWSQFEELFGPGGVQGGCWCSYFFLSGGEFNAAGRAGRREFVHARVQRGEPFGLVASVAGVPSGWVSVVPRLAAKRLGRSPIAKVDAEWPVADTWAVTCFYLDRRARGRGLSKILLAAAIDYARGQGARYVEAYPIATDAPVAVAERYHGTLDLYLAAGFDLVQRRGQQRALVRLDVGVG